VSSLPASLRQALRAESPEPRCAYCHSPERLIDIPLEADHIIPEAAGGKTELGNLCLCCRSCNGYKGKRTHTRDPQTGWMVRLFYPRRQRWSAPFCLERRRHAPDRAHCDWASHDRSTADEQ